MNIIFYDIETISTFSKEEREGLKGLNHLKQGYKLSDKEEKIFNKNSEYLSLKEKYGEKLNFMPEFNKILCISIGFKTPNGGITSRSYSGEETDIINKFFEAIKGRNICGFNIKGFDNPFLVKRALKYGIEIPASLKMFGRKSRENEHIIDLQEIYKSGVFNSYSNLDLVCTHLGITSPKNGGIDGSQVQEFYDNGKEKDIILYCERDVRATIDVYDYFKKYNLI